MEVVSSVNPRGRRKAKWAGDPNNTEWSRDTSKYGHKLLAGMGWKEGAGLGREGKGTLEHVKVKKNVDNRGLGVTQRVDDNWLQVQDAYSSLLSRISEDTAKDVDAKTESNTTYLQDCAASTKRLFYRRFVANKDAAKYSERDMAMILGQRVESTPTSATQSAAASDDDAEEGSSKSTTATPTKGVIQEYEFTTSATSMEAYLASRKRGVSMSVGTSRDASDDDDDEEEQEEKEDDDEDERRPMGLGFTIAQEQTVVERPVVTEDADSMPAKKLKKEQKKRERKERKQKEEEEEAEEAAEEARKKKEKKRSKKRQRDEDEQKRNAEEREEEERREAKRARKEEKAKRKQKKNKE